MSKILKVQVTDKVATYLTRQGDIVCGNSDYKIQFIFDSEWDALPNKVAHFTWNGHHEDVEIDANNQADVPFLVRTLGLKVGVYSGDISTTTAAFIKCRYSARCEETTATEENDKRYENLAKEHADRAEQAAATAAAEAAESAKEAVQKEVENLAGFSLVHTTGDSESAVMSQKAVTKEINALAEPLAVLSENYKNTSMTKISSDWRATAVSKAGLLGIVEGADFTAKYLKEVNILIHDTPVAGIKNDSGVAVTDSSYHWAEFTPVTPGEVLYLDYGAQRIYQYDAEKNWLRRTHEHLYSNIYGAFTVPSDCHYIQVQYSLDSSTYNAANPNVMRPVYTEEAVDSTTLTVSNKNLFAPSGFKRWAIKNDAGIEIADGSSYYEQYIQTVPNESLFINFGAERIYQYDRSKKWLRRTGYSDPTKAYGLFVVPADCYYIQIQFNDIDSVNLSSAQVEKGSEETSYVAHEERSIVWSKDSPAVKVVLNDVTNISTSPSISFDFYAPIVSSSGVVNNAAVGTYGVWEPEDVTDEYSCTPLGQASQSIPKLTETLKYSGFLDTYFNKYLGVHADGYSVTRKDLGLDSGAEATDHYANSVYSYEFKPQNYSKTVLLSAGMNVCEASTYFGLAYFIKALMEHTEEGMLALYNTTRFIVIPVICPSGIAHSPLLYPNSNNVRINKNFEYYGSWERLKTDRGGAYPDSEVETKILKRWLNEYTGADFWLDCHSDTSPSTISKHLGTIFCSDYDTIRRMNANKQTIIDFYKAKGYIADSDAVLLGFNILDKETSPYPKTNYGYDVCGIPSAMMEQFMYSTAWGSDGDTNNDAHSIKHYVTMIRYMVLAMCRD